MKYRVCLYGHHAPEVARREIKSADDIPNFEEEDINEPYDLGDDACTDPCLEAPGAYIWFEDEKGRKVAKFELNPLSKNGIRYIDEGDFFDESKKSKSYFYFEMDWDKQTWRPECQIEIDGEIKPEKISIKFFRFKDQDGDKRLLMNPNSVRYDGKEVIDVGNEGGGTDGQVCWTLINGVRTVVDPYNEDEDDD